MRRTTNDINSDLTQPPVIAFVFFVSFLSQFVIISNKSFEAKTGMGVRNGTDVDAENLYLRFSKTDSNLFILF